MSVRRSTENLAVAQNDQPQAQEQPQAQPQTQTQASPPPPNFDVCGICKNNISIRANSTKTICNHIFHKTCLSKSTQNKTTCPTCNTQIILPKSSKPNTSYKSTVMTRNQSRQQNIDAFRSANISASENLQTTHNITQSSDSSPDAQRHMIRNRPKCCRH
ncbi:hypothetical protein FF38_01249 [Lucilia cuprina]|uniref:RING-type domain-containing protein n=1 Tax=Lucilia cuprina TaxID=7375 RepID=A0A0L0CHE3_LUCCU|nr:hypothetical protein FF38_01249 [Lucilia cuprina]